MQKLFHNEHLRKMGTSPSPPPLPQTTTRVGSFHSAVIYLTLYKPTVSRNLTLSARNSRQQVAKSVVNVLTVSVLREWTVYL